MEGALTCHSFGSARELGPGRRRAVRQRFAGLVVVFWALLVPGGRGAGGRPGLRRGGRWRRARGLARLCKRNGVGAERLGVPPGCIPLPSRPLCRTTPGVVFSGINQSHLPPSHPSTRLGEQRDRREGFGGGVGAVRLCSRSPCCNASGVRAPSPKSQIPSPKREELVTRSLSSCFPPIPKKRALSSPRGAGCHPPSHPASLGQEQPPGTASAVASKTPNQWI